MSITTLNDYVAQLRAMPRFSVQRPDGSLVNVDPTLPIPRQWLDYTDAQRVAHRIPGATVVSAD